MSKSKLRGPVYVPRIVFVGKGDSGVEESSGVVAVEATVGHV